MLHAKRNAEIVRLRKSGLYPTEIAKRLGLTRNAVIGVLNRAGMCDASVDRSALMRRFGVRGEAHPTAVLTAEMVRAIRREYVPYHRELGASALARRYGVYHETVLKAIRGESWAHVA